MYINIINYNHPQTKYIVTDVTPKLNLPIIPEKFVLVFKEKYTGKLESVTGEKFEKVFRNNLLKYDITIFNNIFEYSEEELSIHVESCFNMFSSNIVKFNNDFNLEIGNENIQFIGCPGDLYTAKEANELAAKVNLLKNKISFFLKMAKKKEIEKRLEELKNKVTSLIS